MGTKLPVFTAVPLLCIILSAKTGEACRNEGYQSPSPVVDDTWYWRKQFLYSGGLCANVCIPPARPAYFWFPWDDPVIKEILNI